MRVVVDNSAERIQFIGRIRTFFVGYLMEGEVKGLHLRSDKFSSVSKAIHNWKWNSMKKIKKYYSSVHIKFHIFMMVQITKIFQAKISSNDSYWWTSTLNYDNITTDFPAISKERLHYLNTSKVSIKQWNAVLQCLQHHRGHSNCNNICNSFSNYQKHANYIYRENDIYMIIINIPMFIMIIYSWIWAFT